jgi:hypothetical protein
MEGNQMPKPLRAVAPGELPAPPKTIKAAAELSERSLLVALRDKLAGELDNSDIPAHAIRGLVSELRDVDKAIRLLDQKASGPGSVIAETDDEPLDASPV